MIVECQKCGAPLDVVEGQRLARCAYCGVTSQVQSHRTMAQPVAAQASQAPVWPQPMPQPMHPQPVRASPAVGAVPGLVGALIVVGIGLGMWSARRGSLVVRGVHADAPATAATVTLSTGVPVARTLHAIAGGPVRGATLGATCRGYYPAAPHLSLRVTSPQRVQITTQGNDDLTMALRLPGPVYRCDDDSGQGSNPLLDMTLLPGVYPVWIGSYRENTTPSFILDLQTVEPGLAESATVLTPNLPATLGTLALVGPTSTATRSGIAGGLVNASLLGSSCRGYIPAGPHLTLTTTGYGHVVVTTRATGDLTLVVRDAQGALHCDDDSGGSLQPRVAAMLPAGQHQVWVGTYNTGQRTSFDLMVHGGGIPATEPLRNALRPEAIPTVATLDLDRESSAHLRGGIAGTFEARRISPGCVGWVMAAPQLRMVTRTPRHVTITATSNRDLTLLVRGPGGDVVCADDHNGSPNPTLEADIGVGETNVWIGSYSSASPTRFRVQVTSQAPRVARSVK